MKPSPRPSPELLQWAASILAREQCQKLYGKVVIHFENGVIVRTSTEKTEVPPPK